MAAENFRSQLDSAIGQASKDPKIRQAASRAINMGVDNWAEAVVDQLDFADQITTRHGLVSSFSIQQAFEGAKSDLIDEGINQIQNDSQRRIAAAAKDKDLIACQRFILFGSGDFSDTDSQAFEKTIARRYKLSKHELDEATTLVINMLVEEKQRDAQT